MNTKRLREIREKLDSPQYKGPSGRCLSRDLMADALDALLDGEEQK